MRIGQTKNNIVNLLKLYTFTRKEKKKEKKEEVANETVKIEQTKTTIAKLP